LTLRLPPGDRVDVEGLTPDRTTTLGADEIASMPVWIGGRRANLGDAFDVQGERAARLVVAGTRGNVDGIGAGMTGGELFVDGDAGHRVGAQMTGGSIEVRGSVGDDAGLAMRGGTVRISGNAGDRLGSALPGASRGMTGGEVFVEGSTGAHAAARIRRGLIAVGGDAGPEAGRAMIAGTLVVVGRTGANPGRLSKRGSVIAVRGIEVPETYRYACTFQPPHVRLTLTHLRRRYGLVLDDAVVDGMFRRYCGDAAEIGKGEILVWTGSENR
jgi:formylmethanofuran dehydrogenase subunit C